MSFNLTEITNKQVGVVEQNGVNFVYVQPRVGSNVVLNNMQIGKAAPFLEGFNQITDTASTYSYGTFRFRGRRVGILVGLYPTFGVVGFDIDGVDYGTIDLSKNAPSGGIYNVPYIIATDLPDGDHILTFTKLSSMTSNGLSIDGFLVENSANVQTFIRTGFDYHDMLDSSGVATTPTQISTTSATLRSMDTWVHNFTISNTTANPVTVTLSSFYTTIIGPFSIPANDVRQLTGPIFFKGGIKAVASASGVFVTVGGQ